MDSTDNDQEPDNEIYIYNTITDVYELLMAIAEVEGRPDPTVGDWVEEDEDEESSDDWFDQGEEDE